MAFVRIFADDSGKSSFEDISLPFEPSDLIHTGVFSQTVTGINFRRQPAGLIQDWHTAPRLQYVITLTGMAELEAGTGEKRRFGPGDVLLASDLTGGGHVTRVIGSESRISVSIPIEQFPL